MIRERIRTIVFSALLAPYAISMVGMFTSYFAFFHKPDFQADVMARAENRLDLIVLTSAEFARTEWTDGKREFEHGGKMFDVARIEQKGDLFYVYCDNDTFEDLFINYLKGAGAKSKSGPLAHVQFFEPIHEFNCNNFAGRLTATSGIAVNLYMSVPDELNTPPPRIS